MLFIHGIGHFHPENVIDNQFLESLDINTTNERILERVGIRERRTILPLDYIRQTYNKDPRIAYQQAVFTNAQTGSKAVKIALEQAQLTPQQIGMVIAGSCSSQHLHPADACIIAAELGIQVPAFDLNSACSTFAAHLHFINQMQAESLPDYILLVIPDNTTRSIDYTDRRAAVLWGDGTVALIVSKKHPSSMQVSYTSLHSDPSGWKNITLPPGGYFTQEGNVVQRFAIKTTLETLDQIRNIFHIAANNHYFIGHQANLMMLQSICNRANVSESKHLYNVDKFGNCGAASAPSVLSQNWLHFKVGDQIIVVVVGAGLTWGGALIEKI